MADPFVALPIPAESIPDLDTLSGVDLDPINDFMIIRDSSDGADKKITPNDLAANSVGSASQVDIGVSRFATTAEAQALSELDIAISPGTLGDAFEPYERDKTPQLLKKSPTVFFGERGSAYSAIAVIADSNGEGAGSSGDLYVNGYLSKFMRAVANSFDTGVGTDRGFRYESILNLAKAGVHGINSNGTLITPGGGAKWICDSRLSLANGQSIFITGREISTADVFYDASMSTGSFEWRLNGVLVGSAHAITGTGLKNTYPTNLIATGFYIKETDTVEIRSVGGTAVVTEILAIRSSNNTPLLYSIPRQGWGFTQFSDAARVSEAAAHINQFASGGMKLVIICLGTNNQSGVVGTQLSPSAYVTALDNMINLYRAALTVSGSITKFSVWIPHETIDARPLGTYGEYIDAVSEYCENSIDTQCIRLDMSAVGREPAYLFDNRHFNDFGHGVTARFLCDSFGIPQKFDIPTARRYMYAGIDYTPVVYGASTAGVNTYAVGATNLTKYLLDGSKCNFSSTVTLTAKGTAGNAMAGALRLRCFAIQGQGGNKAITVSRFSGVTFTGGAYTQLGAVIVNGTNAIALIKSGSGLADAELTIAEISDSFSITLGGSFLAQ